MGAHDPRQRKTPDDRAPLRGAVIAIATIAWAVGTLLPIIVPRIPAVEDLTPAFIAFLGATIAAPEIGRLRSNRKDDGRE